MLTTPPPASPRRPRVVVVTADVVGARMAGPGIRFVEIATQLTQVADVTLAVGIEGSETESLAGRGFAVREFRGRDELVALVSAHDVAFCQLIDDEVVRQGAAAGCRFVFDLYNALPAEAIGAERIGGFDTQPQMDDVFSDVLSFFRFCMRAGSYFVTSNERQRDFWVGYMMSAGGLLPSDLRGRHTSDLIGLVPFGMEDGEPHADRRAIRGELGIGEDDLVLLWAGGIWDWFDAETPIRAVAELRRERPDVHLVFYGTTHPNSLIGKPKTVERAEEVARELGVLGAGVHFIEGWVPAAERAAYLLDADVAICAHKESFETRYAFRTRVLDHFWATLPSIVTEGDWFSEYIRAGDLGDVVGYGDVAGTVDAIRDLSDRRRREQVRGHVAAIRDDWRWSATTSDLRSVVADWETRLLPRDVPAREHPEPVPTAPGRLARARAAASRSPLGAVYRALRRRLGALVRALRQRHAR
ncbi:glycosyltransferase [Microbacterium atlanticum]|uniref:glycosyltransferase n=1 Tax=Microbacterium atlanticum TaxID=2782168 RepID=UPI001887704E|nr:glycosyltransferase [Microbacterium atlanticum]